VHYAEIMMFLLLSKNFVDVGYSEVSNSGWNLGGKWERFGIGMFGCWHTQTNCVM